MSEVNLSVLGEDAMMAFGKRLADVTAGRGTIHLIGDLGMGKTTLSRGLIRGLGHEGAVKSPTFTLVEPYEIDDVRVFHFDLYRLVDPEELEFLGIRDYDQDDVLCLIEWPEKGKGFLPKPDLIITISAQPGGRSLCLTSGSQLGNDWCAALAQNQ